MRPAVPLLVFVAVLLPLTPLAAAEFGPESEDGWPVNVDGAVLRPPVEPVELPAGWTPLNKVGPFTAFPYYPLLTAEVQRLAGDHPGLVRLTSAGTSTAGLDMWLLEIADFHNLEKGEGVPLAEREVVYLDGGTHSNEYSGVYFVTEVAQFLLDEYETNETARWIVENRHTWILPMVNPDGSNAFGRLNAMVVNINRNFPGTWGTVDETPIVNNPGPEPASEVETQNVIKVLETVRPDYVNSIHCCGNLWLHPYGAEELPTPEDVQMYTRICDDVFHDVRSDCGEIWSTIYPASGTTADEGYERVGASSWSYEMSGRGRVLYWGQPVIVDDVREQERESWRGVIHAFLNVHKYGAHPVLVALEGAGGKLEAVVENVGYGNLTKGTLRIGDAEVPLPALGPGERATVPLEGSFAAGSVEARFDWVKRHRLEPTGTRTLALALVQTGNRLVADLGDEAALAGAAADLAGGLQVPGAGGFLAVLALTGAVGLFRRRK